jgi:hypothetical protein
VKDRRDSCWFSANLPEQDADMATSMSNHIPARLAHGKPDFLVEIFKTVASLDMANPVPHTPD